MTMILGVFLSLIGLDPADRDPWLECSLIGVTVTALNLGEVLVELAAAISIGFALAHLLAVRRRHAISASGAGPDVRKSITLITNNGEVGGGEVMLVALAQAVRDLGGDSTCRWSPPTEPDAAAELARVAA